MMFIKYKLQEFSFPSGFRRRRAAGREWMRKALSAVFWLLHFE